MSEKVKRYTMDAPEYGMVEANCQCEDNCDCWKIKPKEIEWVNYLDYARVARENAAIFKEFAELKEHDDFISKQKDIYQEFNEDLKKQLDEIRKMMIQINTEMLKSYNTFKSINIFQRSSDWRHLLKTAGVKESG